MRNGTGLCGHDGKDIAFLFVHICSWATGYYPHHDIRSFSSGRFNYIHAYTWIPYTLKLCAIPATCHSNTLDCDIGGAKELGVIYFPNWGAFQRFFESSNSWRVALDIRGPGGSVTCRPLHSCSCYAGLVMRSRPWLNSKFATEK